MWRHLPTATILWAYFIWLAEGVATILCAKLVFMLFTISLKRIKTLYYVLLGKWQLKKAKVIPISTEWIVLVRSIKYVVAITKEFTYSSSDRQLEDISEGSNTDMHENAYFRKINLQKNARNLGNLTKNF